VGRALAERGIRLVYGAGNVGLMGILADAALAAGGRVLGVIPHFLQEREVCHTGLHELVVTRTMHERKEVMAARSDGFIILPGGFGTLDECFEILTWRQLHLHAKPIGLLNPDGFYDHLLAHIRLMLREGFLVQGNADLLSVAPDIGRLLPAMGWDAG
jgi:uncharacterized protein (TIGR00730 family)